MIDHDHREICKFSSLESEAFKPILHEVLEIARELQIAKPSTYFRPDLILASGESAIRFRSDAILKATFAGNTLVVKRLIATHTDVNTCDDQQRTPLHLACQHHHTEIATLLLESGADVSATDLNESTPLHQAASAGQATLVTAILARGGDANSKDKDGWTPLHHAAHVGSQAIAESLIEHGANCIAHNAQGDIPASVARKAHRRHLEAYLQLHVLRNKEVSVSLLGGVASC